MKLDFIEKMGIQSFCFRGLKTHEQVVEALRTCGVNAIELSHSHYRPWEKDNHDEIISFYRERGITISAHGAYGVSADVDGARRVFEFAKAAGFETLVVMFDEGGIETAEKLSEEYGVRVALHNHGRQMRYGASWELEEVFANTTANIGLCLDTAWMIDARENPIDVARRFAERLYAVHLKDFVFEPTGKPKDVIVGEGNLDLPGFLRTLVDVGFDGVCTLEYEGDVDNPVPATKACVAAVRAAAEAL